MILLLRPGLAEGYTLQKNIREIFRKRYKTNKPTFQVGLF